MKIKCDISELKGKIITNIFKNITDKEDTILLFSCKDEKYNSDILFEMSHEHDCSESVTLEEIIGDINDILYSSIIEAEKVTNTNDPPLDKKGDDSYLWTFYKIGTKEGFVTLRWYGTSNGFYSEEVDFFKIKSYQKEENKS